MKKLTEELKPNKNVATESANVAHEFLACFQKMEFLPFWPRKTELTIKVFLL